MLNWSYRKILDHIKQAFSTLEKLSDEPNSTSISFRVSGYSGSIGIIPAFSRTFCGTCNRIRVTAQGTLKTCLYDNGVLDIRALLRSNASNDEIKKTLIGAFRSRPKDGFEAERLRGLEVTESMSTIGG